MSEYDVSPVQNYSKKVETSSSHGATRVFEAAYDETGFLLLRVISVCGEQRLFPYDGKIRFIQCNNALAPRSCTGVTLLPSIR